MQSKSNPLPVVFASVLSVLVLGYLVLPVSVDVVGRGILTADSDLRRRAAARDLLSRSMRASTYPNFKDRDFNPTAIKLHTPCFHAKTDELVAKAFVLINKVVLRPSVFHPTQSHPTVSEDGRKAASMLSVAAAARFDHHALFEPDDERDEPILRDALELVQQALVEHVNCPRLHVMAGAILIRLGRDGPATTLLEEAVVLYPEHPELLLLTGFLYELLDRPAEARNMYLHSIQWQPRYSKEFFGVPIDLAHNQTINPLLILRDIARSEDSNKRVQSIIHIWALRRLMLAFLFAEDYAAGPALKREEARQWQKQWYFHVQSMISPYAAYIARAAFRQLILSGTLAFNDGQAIRFTSYNDPTARFLLATHTRVISRITDMPMKPTYCYLGAYLGSEKSELSPHTDRPQCEFTSSTSIDVSPVGAECPLGLNPVAVGMENHHLDGEGTKNPGPEDRQVYVYPKPGDSLLFKGRHLVHWRKPIPDGVNCTNIFMHYVHEEFDGGLN